MGSKRRESVWIYHVISGILLMASICYTFSLGWNVTLRAWQAIKDVGNSCAYYTSFMLDAYGFDVFDASATVQYIPESMDVFMPASWAEIKEYCAGFWSRFSSKAYLKGYFAWLGTGIAKGSKGFLLVFILAMPLILCVILSFILSDESYGKQSIPLRIWLFFEKFFFFPIVRTIKRWWRFIHDEDKDGYKIVNIDSEKKDKDGNVEAHPSVVGKRYRIVFIAIWMFNLNIATIGFEFIAWMLWVGPALGFYNIFTQIAKLALDLSVGIRTLPKIVSIVLGLWIFHKYRRHIGFERLSDLEKDDMQFLEDNPGNYTVVGKPRVGKTKLITLLARLENKRFRFRAKRKMMEDMKQFPALNWHAVRQTVDNFRKLPKFGLEYIRGFCEELQSCFESRKSMSDKERKGTLKNFQAQGYVGDDFIFGYDYEKFGMTYNNGLILIPIWRALTYYMEEYAIYTSDSLVISNYPIRSTIRFKQRGRCFPVMKSNCFKLRPQDVESATTWSHIIPHDGLRLGVKYNPDGKYNNSIDSGLLVISEAGKEFGNQITNRGKDKAGGCNPTNDLWMMNAKMISHAMTVNYECYTRIMVDEQRSGSIQTDFNELGTKLTLKRRTKDKIMMPFFALEEAAYMLICSAYDKIYEFYWSRHGKDCLTMHALSWLDGIINSHYVRTMNVFGSNDVKLRTTDESSGETMEKSKDETLHVMKGMTDGDVYDTGFFGIVYREKFKRSEVGGREKIPCFTSKSPTIPQMVFQQSHMYKEVFKYFKVDEFNDDVA
ncbi:MAG: hypothetical protein E7357_01340 [Clostridiales bacterium]|nr:hypothetical protein [Clostridiales bacterium]